MNVLIAMPCYQGQVNVDTAKCVMNLTLLLSKHSIRSEYFTLSSESLIPRARNACVAYFLSKEFTHLLFIDADVVFDPNLVLTLLRRDESLSGCPYPKKTYNWDMMTKSVIRSLDWNKIKESLSEDKNLPSIIKEQEELVDSSLVIPRMMNYVYNPISNNINVRDGWMQVSEIGTGFMLAKREVFQSLINMFPEMKYTNDVAGYNNMHPDMKDNFYLFFDCRTENNRYLSEDYAFCKLAKQVGHKIWLYTNARVSHTGNHTFTGNLLHTLSMITSDAKEGYL